MSHKNTSILFTLLGSVFMMVIVSVLFHLPTGVINGGITSSFFAWKKEEELQEIAQEKISSYHGIDLKTMSYIPKQYR